MANILVFLSISLVAHSQGVNYDYLMLQLEADLKLGRARSLRDVGSVLNLADQKLRAQQLLKDYTLFLPDEVDLSAQLDKESFLNFYYTNAENFKYSEILNAFYLTPVEEWTPKFELIPFEALGEVDRALLLRKHVLEFEKAIEDKNATQIIKTLKLIKAQKSNEAYRYLCDVLEKEIFPNQKFPNREKAAKIIASCLSQYPVERALKLLSKLTSEELIDTQTGAFYLAKLTNHLPSQTSDAKSLAGEYEDKVSELGGFEEMRQAGYHITYSFNSTFFEFPVDFYGRVLSLSEQKSWLQHNALKDVVETHHPRALFYIAAQIYQYRDRLDIDKYQFVDLLEQLTEVKIKVQGSQDFSEEHNWNSDNVAQRNYIAYWAAHYEDYEWDEIRGQFINKTEKLELTKNYERLFRRLNSKNDSIAQQAWLLLSEGDPVEVIGLANKYKELLRNYNTSLPSFKYRYLEQAVQLTDYCKRNKIRYEPSTKARFWLDKLLKSENEKERYEIENRVINTVTADEITAIEYWGLLNENNKQAAFSVGRILDWYYSENWDAIISNEKNLRLYLKKARLFADIGVIGVCNHYMNKFGILYPQLTERLNNLLRVETDEDIINGISFLIFNNQHEDGSVVQGFILDPSSVKKNEIADLPKPNEEEINLLFRRLREEERASVRTQLLQYLMSHKDVAYVPQLMELLPTSKDKKQIVSLLGKIYNHSFKDKEQGWLAIWEKDKRNFRKWEKKFFNDKIKSVENLEAVVNVKDLNAIVRSRFYEPEKQKELVLRSLSRLKSVKYVRRFRVEPLLNMPSDLVYFENLNLTEKELDDIPRLFDLSNPKPMVAFLVRQTEGFDIEEKGSFFNNLFRSNWFANYVNDGRVSKHIGSYIRKALDTYLNESDLISEFEEQATVRNIALLDISNLPLEDKMNALLQLRNQVNSEALQQVQKAILSRVDYLDISRIAPFFPELTALERYNFLNRDFGLPLFDLNEPKVRQELITIHQRYINDQEKFYCYYLDQFGVDYKTEEGKIDYAKVYRILKYDIVTPFVGDGGNRRDYFTYGIIKLLEKDFGTSLGFHPKLNENQTFYSFSSAKRATAWMDYLEEQSLVSRVNESKSFNWTRVE